MVVHRMKLTLMLSLAILLNSAVSLNAYAYYGEDNAYENIGIYDMVYYPYYDRPELGPLLGPQLPVPEPVVQAPQPLCYKVNSGDTLYKIARDFGVTIAALMVENELSNPHLLSIGQQLRIPDAEALIPLPDGQRQVVKQVLSSTLTAYTAGFESTGKTPASSAYGITYSGSKAAEGRTIAVDPSVIPIGSTVFIDGIGIRKAEDTGSAVRGARIDVFMDDVKQAVNFGVKRNVKVYILSGENV